MSDIDRMHALLGSFLNVSARHELCIDLSDWEYLESKLSTTFPKELKLFLTAVSDFTFPGDILIGKPGTPDAIDTVYELEMSTGMWNSDMIPFYAIGNGDYFCVSKQLGESSPIYYSYHDNGRIVEYADSVHTWLHALPAFLS